jgi:hypothetical protein
MSTWNTKRDGYYSRPVDPNPLGKPLDKLAPNAGTTHVVTIPGTTYRCFLQLDETGASTPNRGIVDGIITRPVQLEALLKALSRTTTAGTGKRRIKATPVLTPIAEFQALTTVKAAA